MAESHPAPNQPAGPDGGENPKLPENAANSGAPRRKTSWALAFVLLAVIAAAFIYFVFERVAGVPGSMVDKSAEMASKIRDAIVQTANIEPRVMVNNTVHYEQAASILELALTTRQTLVEREVDHTWLGSTKRVRLRGTYEVKAGFDLSRPFSVVVEDEKAAVKLPPARILSVEAKNIEVMMLRDGLWNKINPDDVELELNTLNLMAREKMLQSNINDDAEKEILRRLRERLGPDLELDVQIGQQPPVPLIQG